MQLARATQLRPNTLTSIIRHGRETDTRTLRRIAEVLDIDIAELMMTAEQRQALRAYRERRVERIAASVLEHVEQEIRNLVRSALEEADPPQRPTDAPGRPAALAVPADLPVVDDPVQDFEG